MLTKKEIISKRTESPYKTAHVLSISGDKSRRETRSLSWDHFDEYEFVELLNCRNIEDVFSANPPKESFSEKGTLTGCYLRCFVDRLKNIAVIRHRITKRIIFVHSMGWERDLNSEEVIQKGMQELEGGMFNITGVMIKTSNGQREWFSFD